MSHMDRRYHLDPLSAYKYDHNADKVGKPIVEDISFLDPPTSRGPQGALEFLLTLKNILTCTEWPNYNLETILWSIGNRLVPLSTTEC
jgi:hypothetical protein